MKVYDIFTFGLASLLSLSAMSSSAKNSYPNDSHTKCTPRGNYSYNLTGSFGAPPVFNTIREAGSLYIDGFGNVTVFGVQVINGSLVQNASAVCTYSIPARSANGSISCIVTAGGISFPLELAFSYGDCCDYLTLISIPGPPSPFPFIQVSGSAQK